MTPLTTDSPIGELELSVRAMNALDRVQVATIGELTALTLNDLMRIRNIGKLTLREIQAELARNGFSLAGSEMRTESAVPKSD